MKLIPPSTLSLLFLFFSVSCNSTKTTSIEFSDGSYQGEIDKKGKKQGKGIYVWHDGSTYEGDFKNDSRHGNGYFKWSNGESYKGDYFEDSRTGEGIYRWPDGSYYEGSFLNGKRHGFGVFHSLDGSIYEGEWFDDLQHGEGVRTNPEKTTIKAVWRNGKIITKPSVLPRTATKPTLEKIELPIAPELPNTTQVKTETKEKISLSNPSNSIRSRKEVSTDNANAPPSENLWGAKEIGLKEPIKQVIEQPTPSASSPKEQPTSKIALVEQAQLNANPLTGSPQLNSGSSNIWTGTVSEAEDQFDTNLINGIDTVSDSKSKQPFSGKMQILNLNGNLIGEVNLLDGQLHGEEVFIDESGVITERNLWEKGVRIQ